VFKIHVRQGFCLFKTVLDPKRQKIKPRLDGIGELVTRKMNGQTYGYPPPKITQIKEIDQKPKDEQKLIRMKDQIELIDLGVPAEINQVLIIIWDLFSKETIFQTMVKIDQYTAEKTSDGGRPRMHGRLYTC